LFGQFCVPLSNGLTRLGYFGRILGGELWGGLRLFRLRRGAADANSAWHREPKASQ